MDILYDMLAGYQLPVILLMIFVDLGFGVAAAFRTKTFDFERVADFYQTQVLPDIIGYTVLHVAVRIAAMYSGVVDLLGEYSVFVSEGLLAIGLAAIIARLGKSAVASFKRLGWTVE